MLTQPDTSAEPQPQPGVPVDKPTSHLMLTPEREKWLVTLAIDLLKETEKEMGRGARGETRVGSFLWIRKRNADTHANDLEWRKSTYGGVFADGNNFTRSKSTQIQRIMSAKIIGDVLDTDPFFASIPRRAADPQKVKHIEAFVQDKIDRAGIPQLLREAVSAALTRNETIPHFWYDLQVSKFRGPATVAIDPVTKQPIRTPKKGFYIYENDDTVKNPDVQGEVILKKDPSFSTRTQLEYMEFSDLEQEEILWDGLRGTMLDNRDFICPTNVNSIHDAKFCARRFDREWGQMRVQYKGFDTAEAYFNNRPESAEKSRIEMQGIQNEGRSDLIKWVPVAEVYIRCDADEDDSEEDIFLVLDMENEEPIFYDYMRNHMKKRPFEVIVGLRKEPNTWAGVGVYSETLDANTFIDLTLNRVNKQDSQQGSATFYQEKACKEWLSELRPRIGGPEAMRLNPGFNNTDNPPIFRINLTEVSELSMLLSDKASQDLAVMFGASGAQNAGALDLDRSKTASGSVLIEKEGNMIVNETVKAVSVGLIACLEQCVDIILEHMDDTELFLTKEMELVELNREEIRGIEKDIKLLLTKSRSSEGLARSQQVVTMLLQYAALSPVDKKLVRDIVIDELKKLDVTDAEERLPQITPEEITAFNQSQAQGQQQPPNASVSVKLSDLAPSERSQVLQKEYGITPASAQEVQAFESQKRLEEVAQKRAESPPDNVTPMNKEKAA